MSASGKVLRVILTVVSLCLLGYGLVLALWVSPPDADQGNMIRAFYYHFPNWIGAGVFLPLNLLASVTYLYLRSKDDLLAMKADSLALATAEMGVLYCTLGMVTGSLWGRVAWGIWWAWDARLTTTLMLWLIYVSYLMIRRTTASSGRGVICAVLAIFGFVDIPIVYMSTRWWRTQHPAPVFGGEEGSGVAPTMQSAVWFNVLAWVAWGALIVSFRYATEYRRQKQEHERALRSISSTEGMAYGD
ncbi:cytochrome c biogenesis protein CcsA [Terriglobus sp. TAA 43]|uniref:cytochrome c biogenesis protein CcsA n=1 Tax=Terriglobus sp. TAA 43 TaxID=278961 RepID=UPI00069225C7|nr:cytochrome c biogenesis protein CcsA [Terriglobus sp. TAA 43]